MGDKYLAEIKARYELGRPAQQREVKALLAEVERLTAENEKTKPFYKIADDTFKHWENAAYAMRDEERARSAAKDEQIATLTRALELAEDMLTKMTPFKSKGGWHDRLIQQAQEQEEENEKV